MTKIAKIILVIALVILLSGCEINVETTGGQPTGRVNSEANNESQNPNRTLAQSNAIRSAQQYLNLMAFSRTRLIEQLEFEGFSTEDATYAVDNITVDWYEQAYRSGQSYLETMPFSRSALISQLEFENFSTSQATQAVDRIGL